MCVLCPALATQNRRSLSLPRPCFRPRRAAAALSLEHYLLRESDEGCSDDSSSEDDDGEDEEGAEAKSEAAGDKGDEPGLRALDLRRLSLQSTPVRGGGPRQCAGREGCRDSSLLKPWRLPFPSRAQSRWGGGSGGLAGDAAQSDTDESDTEVGCSGLAERRAAPALRWERAPSLCPPSSSSPLKQPPPPRPRPRAGSWSPPATRGPTAASTTSTSACWTCWRRTTPATRAASRGGCGR